MHSNLSRDMPIVADTESPVARARLNLPANVTGAPDVVVSSSKGKDLGVKRACASCGAKFYDFGKTEPTCPRCGKVFDIHAVVVAPPPRIDPVKEAQHDDEEVRRSRLLAGVDEEELELAGAVDEDDEVGFDSDDEDSEGFDEDGEDEKGGKGFEDDDEGGGGGGGGDDW